MVLGSPAHTPARTEVSTSTFLYEGMFISLFLNRNNVNVRAAQIDEVFKQSYRKRSRIRESNRRLSHSNFLVVKSANVMESTLEKVTQ